MLALLENGNEVATIKVVYTFAISAVKRTMSVKKYDKMRINTL